MAKTWRNKNTAGQSINGYNYLEKKLLFPTTFEDTYTIQLNNNTPRHVLLKNICTGASRDKYKKVSSEWQKKPHNWKQHNNIRIGK